MCKRVNRPPKADGDGTLKERCEHSLGPRKEGTAEMMK